MLTLCYSQDVVEEIEVVHLPYGEALRTVRRMQGLTQEQLAEALNTEQSTVSKWEKRTDPLSDYLALSGIADALAWSIEDQRAGRVTRRVLYRPQRLVQNVQDVPREQETVNDAPEDAETRFQVLSRLDRLAVNFPTLPPGDFYIAIRKLADMSPEELKEVLDYIDFRRSRHTGA